MQVHGPLQALVDRLQDQVGAEHLYVVDIDEESRGEDSPVATVIFGVRNSPRPPLAVQFEARKALEDATHQKVGVEVFSEPLDEVEYIFDRYLRAYIATHGGIVTPVKIEEPEGRLWISMDGGCSGCPSSIATLKHGIERTLKKHLPWVQHVEAVNEAEEPDFGIKLDFTSPFAADDAAPRP
jgi:Fe/S biogenesis protein NfuA